MSYPPISAYALLSDCHSAALVSPDGSVDWCCFDRFDARPVFGRLLDWRRGGHFGISPAQPYRSTRRYRPGTNILETRFETDSGVLVLTDCLAMHDTPAADEGGSPIEPCRQLIRQVRCEAGEVEVSVKFRPRFDYGLVTPQVTLVGPGLATVFGGADALLLQSDLLSDQTGLATVAGTRTLKAGEQAMTVLTYELPHRLRPKRVEDAELRQRLEATERFWTAWSRRCTYEGPYQEQVLRSALVLKSLTNSPTGALVAAPTTSLPEEVGGVRNWDYRYTWVRDSAFTLYAMFTLGYTEEAHAFMNWVARTTAGRADQLQVVYGVGGERLLPEIELSGLEGYRGSRPVRVGNAAADQFQLDTYGEVLDTAWLYHRYGGTIDAALWGFLRHLVEYVGQVWREPDDGIWEVRGERQHFVYSKAMAWVAVDRGIRLARRLGFDAPLDRWRALRAEIQSQVDDLGVEPATGAFVAAFGSYGCDAATLLLPLVHYPADAARIRATVEHVERRLVRDGLVYRYRGVDDGLPGREGAFLICSFWLVDNLVLTGELERARELFERLLTYANDVGLLAEQIDPETGEQLGNFPQAFSHMGLINSAIQLQRHAIPTS